MFTSCNVESVLVGERLSSLMAAKDLFVPTAADAMARISSGSIVAVRCAADSVVLTVVKLAVACSSLAVAWLISRYFFYAIRLKGM